MQPSVAPDRLRRKAITLQYATIVWNVGEAVIAIGLGLAAGSLALIAFGSDSVIEVFSSVVVLWHLRREDLRDRTRRALRLVGMAFVLLAVVLAVAAARDLLTGRRADESWWGIVYLAVAAAGMFALAVAKRRLARDLGSEPFAAEAEMTFLDGLLSAATLLGLSLNAVLGWWWADPGAGLFIGVMALREALECFEGAGRIPDPPPAPRDGPGGPPDDEPP